MDTGAEVSILPKPASEFLWVTEYLNAANGTGLACHGSWMLETRFHGYLFPPFRFTFAAIRVGILEADFLHHFQFCVEVERRIFCLAKYIPPLRLWWRRHPPVVWVVKFFTDSPLHRSSSSDCKLDGNWKTDHMNPQRLGLARSSEPVAGLLLLLVPPPAPLLQPPTPVFRGGGLQLETKAEPLDLSASGQIHYIIITITWLELVCFLLTGI